MPKKGERECVQMNFVAELTDNTVFYHGRGMVGFGVKHLKRLYKLTL